MANNIKMPLFVAAAIVWIAVPATAGTASTKASSMPAGAQTALYGSYGSTGGAGHYDNRWRPMGEREAVSSMSAMLQRYGLRYDGAEGERRSFRSDSSSLGGHGGGGGGVGAVLNGLTNLSGLGHISNGYASVAPTHTEALAAASSKQEIPIYEEQHEDAAVAALAASASDYGDTEAGRSGQHSAIYNFPAAGAEHAAGYLPAYGGAEHGAWTPYQQQAAQAAQEAGGSHYAYDKMSVGNFLNSGYDAFQQHHAEEQQHQHQQQQHQQQLLEHASYFTPHETESEPSAGSDSAGSGPADYEQQSEGDEHAGNFLADSSAHEDSHGQQHHHHVDIINYVPVKHVKTQHVPVEKPVKIPISHAVIIPIKKPVPIHIPITKQVQVAVEKELKVPVERLVPVPIEKHVPVPVEKRVPYTVIKYLPIKVPKPFPVKVPVFKTVLHKVKSWW